jgi:hypothetical protein
MARLRLPLFLERIALICGLSWSKTKHFKGGSETALDFLQIKNNFF